MGSHRFRKGDRVVCVNDTGMANIASGHTYTVRRVDSGGPVDMVELDEVPGHNYAADRFAPAAPPRPRTMDDLRPGDRVVCQDAAGMLGVSTGGVYTFKSYLDIGASRYIMIQETGATGYMADRFRPWDPVTSSGQVSDDVAVGDGEPEPAAAAAPDWSAITRSVSGG
jgi:hypothetical protein